MAAKGFLKFLIKRIVLMYLIIVAATYLTIVIANMGGYLDNIIKSELRVSLTLQIRNDPTYEGYSPEQIDELIEAKFQQEVERI